MTFASSVASVITARDRSGTGAGSPCGTKNSITRASLHRALRRAFVQPWEGSHFLDLNEEIVAKELHHVRKVRRSGPTAENLLRRLGQGAEVAAVLEAAR